MSYLDTVHAGKLVAFSQFNSPLFIYLLTKKQGFILFARSQTLTCFPLYTLKRKKTCFNFSRHNSLYFLSPANLFEVVFSFYFYHDLEILSMASFYYSQFEFISQAHSTTGYSAGFLILSSKL